MWRFDPVTLDLFVVNEKKEAPQNHLSFKKYESTGYKALRDYKAKLDL